MRHTIKHDLDLALTRQALDAAFASYQARFARHEPMLRWEGEDRARFGFRVPGRALGGTLRLRPGAIEVEMEVPLLLRVFEGRARRAVAAEAEQWIGRARAGELATAPPDEPLPGPRREGARSAR